MNLPVEVLFLILSWLSPEDKANFIQVLLPSVQLTLLRWYFQEKHSYQDMVLFQNKFHLNVQPRIARQIKAGKVYDLVRFLLHPKQIRDLKVGDQLVFWYYYNPREIDTGFYHDLFVKKRPRAWNGLPKRHLSKDDGPNEDRHPDEGRHRTWKTMRLYSDFNRNSGLSSEEFKQLQEHFSKPIVNKVLITKILYQNISQDGDEYHLQMHLKLLPLDSFPPIGKSSSIDRVSDIYCRGFEMLYPGETFTGMLRYELQFSDHQNYTSNYTGIPMFNSNDEFIGHRARYGPGSFLEYLNPRGSGPIESQSIAIIKC